MKGHGWIQVDQRDWDAIGSPETLQEWHDTLLLPDYYEVVGVFLGREVILPHTHILVRSDTIHVCEDLPEIVPLYRREQGKFILIRIDIVMGGRKIYHPFILEDEYMLDGERSDLCKNLPISL